MTGVLRAGAVTILGSEQFYWDSNNIYIFDPANMNRQIRIGQYDGVDYGIGVTQDGGQTWQHAIDFDGVKFSGGIDDINGLRAVLEAQDDKIDAKVGQDEFDALGNRVSETESELLIQAGQISSKVGHDEFDALGNRVSEAESELLVQAGQIESKVGQAEFDALGNRVSSAESSISQQAGEIALKASQQSVDSIAQRVTAAESSITTQAGEIALRATKTEVNTLTGRVSAAESAIQQTPEQISLAVQNINIGGANMLNGTYDTKSIIHTYSADQSTYPITLYDGFTDPYPDKPVRVTHSNSSSSALYAYVTCDKMEIGNTYTFSVDVRNFGNKIYLSTSGNGVITSSDPSYHNNYFKRMYLTFECRTKTQWLSIVMEGGSSFDIRKLKLEAGNKATAWCQSDEELMNSSISITKDSTRIATPVLDIDVTGSNGDTKIDENGLSTAIGSFQTINCPTVVSKTVGSNVTITTPAGLQSFLDANINGRMLIGSCTITLAADQVGDIVIRGVYGNDTSITIAPASGTSHSINGQVKIVDCSVRGLVFNYLTFNCNTKAPIYLQGSRRISVNTCIINTNNQDGIYMDSGSVFDLYDTEIYNANNALLIWTGCVATILYVRGTATNAISSRGAWINWAGSRTSGALGAWASFLNPTNLTNIPINTGTAPQPPVVITTKTYNTSNTGTLYPSDHWISDSIIRQGYSTLNVGNEKLYGCMWFSGASEVRGKTIKSATLTVTRVSGKGRSGSVDVSLYTSTTTGKSGALTNLTSIGALGSIGNGETKTFNIAPSSVAAVANGGCFVFYTSETSLISGKQYSPHYAHFINAVLEVTY